MENLGLYFVTMTLASGQKYEKETGRSFFAILGDLSIATLK